MYGGKEEREEQKLPFFLTEKVKRGGAGEEMSIFSFHLILEQHFLEFSTPVGCKYRVLTTEWLVLLLS